MTQDKIRKEFEKDFNMEKIAIPIKESYFEVYKKGWEKAQVQAYEQINAECLGRILKINLKK